MTVLSFSICLLSVTALLRMITFQRHGSRHRPLVAFCAWFVTCLLATIAIKSMTSQLPGHVMIQGLLFIVLLIFNVHIFKQRGNLARLLRKSHA